MTKLSRGPLWKKNNKWENVGLCYILSTTNLRSEPGVGGRRGRFSPSLCRLHSAGVTGGLRGAGSPPLQGLGQCPTKICFGPYIRLGRPTYGFRSMVLDDSHV